MFNSEAMAMQVEQAKTQETQSPRISVVINTLNEERDIADCIASAQTIASEIVVCDMYSDDRTCEIAEAMGARVIRHQRIGFVEPARYAALSEARYDWVLVLDADERLTEPLGEELLRIASDNRFDVVLFWSLFDYFGAFVRHGGFFSGGWPKFFRKSVYLATYSPTEELLHQNFQALRSHNNKICLDRRFFIIHHAYPDLEKYVSKTIGKYARIEAEGMHERGIRFRLLFLIGAPIRSFLRTYFLKQGFRDGVRGFILSILFATYRFVTWANLWFIECKISQGASGQLEESRSLCSNRE